MNIFQKYSLLTILFATSLANAEIRITPPIPEQEILAKIDWIREQYVAAKLTSIDCAPVTALANTQLCLFPTSKELSQTFLRASLFAEGNPEFPRNQYIPLDHARVRDMIEKNEFSAFDLRAVDISSFESTMIAECATRNIKPCFSPQERAFLDFLHVDPSQRQIILGVSVDPRETFRATVHHVLLNGQYHVDNKYQFAVNKFWNTWEKFGFPLKDKAEITAQLTTAFDTSVESTLIKEFQAYVLELSVEGYSNAKMSFYREALIRFLKLCQLRPIGYPS